MGHIAQLLTITPTSDIKTKRFLIKFNPNVIVQKGIYFLLVVIGQFGVNRPQKTGDKKAYLTQ